MEPEIGTRLSGSQPSNSLQVSEKLFPWLLRFSVEGLEVHCATILFSSTKPSQSSSIPLQVSAVGVPGTQGCGTPPVQTSIVRRQAPTPQVSMKLVGSCRQPVAARQPSAVQGLPSSQLMSVCAQLVSAQAS